MLAADPGLPGIPDRLDMLFATLMGGLKLEVTVKFRSHQTLRLTPVTPVTAWIQCGAVSEVFVFALICQRRLFSPGWLAADEPSEGEPKRRESCDVS